MDVIDIVKIASIILALLVAIVGHEIMHGYTAYRYGDDTAKLASRLSINPIVHIDPIGTILVPAVLYFSGAPFMFGWAKPVPVNINTVINNGGYNAAIAVALAGVTYNFFLAVAFSLILNFVGFDGNANGLLEFFLLSFAMQSIIYNVVLGVFNLWPIPPLDGSNALYYQLLKMRQFDLAQKFMKLQRYGMIILILIIATPLASYFFFPVMKIIELLIK